MAYSAGTSISVAPKIKTPKLPGLGANIGTAIKAPGKIYGTKTVSTTALPKITAKKVRDAYPAEVSMQSKRIGGLTRGLLRNYQESPGRFLPRARGLKPGGSLKNMANARKIKIGV